MMLPDKTNEINQLKKSGLYRQHIDIESAQGAEIAIANQRYINFSSNDYLGLANCPILKEVMIDAITEYGIGSGSAQLLSGHFKTHRYLEKKMAAFLGRDACLIFSAGYLANLALASTLISSKTIVLQDRLNHASLIDAALLSKGRIHRYRHRDTKHLSSLLEKYKHQEIVVITEGVFSMDGDCAPLLDIADLCRHYRALLVVDDAHGIGVLGNTGAGLLESLRCDQKKVPILIGTFGKAFGCCGAFVAGQGEWIDVFIQKARSYIYTTALAPAVAMTLIKAIDVVRDGASKRQTLEKLIDYLKTAIEKIGINRQGHNTHIQPLIIGDNQSARTISKHLFEQYILVPAIRPPTVPKNTARLRISLSAAHTMQHLDKLITVLDKHRWTI